MVDDVKKKLIQWLVPEKNECNGWYWEKNEGNG